MTKVPSKYLAGLSSKEKAERKREIKRRAGKPHSYKPLPGDADAKTKPSKYSKTKFAAAVREEMDGNDKDEFLRAAAKVSGVRRSILNEVHKRGDAAWATGHRPGASQAAWSRARVYSFVTGGKTQKTADADLWEKHMKTKKSAVEELGELLLKSKKKGVIAIGKRGGKIVGYDKGKPIYEGTEGDSGEAARASSSSSTGAASHEQDRVDRANRMKDVAGRLESASAKKLLSKIVQEKKAPSLLALGDGATYQRTEQGSYKLIQGDPEKHSPLLLSGHKAIKGKGHTLEVLAGTTPESTEKFLESMPQGATVRVGVGLSQRNYVKFKDGWKKSVRGYAWQDTTAADIASDSHQEQRPGISVGKTDVVDPKLFDAPEGASPIEARVRRAEASIIGHPHERLYVFDDSLDYNNPKMTFAREGFRGSVSIQPKYYGSLQNKVVTHNHPSSGNSFSPADLGLATAANVREIRAVGVDPNNGAVYIHSMKRPAGGWKANPKSVMNDAKKLFNIHGYAAAASGSSWSDVAHKVSVDLAKKYGWDYSREKLNK